MKKPRVVYVLYYLDGSSTLGVFSTKAKAALWNYENGRHADIKEFIIDDPEGFTAMTDH